METIECAICKKVVPKNPRNDKHKYCSRRCKDIGWQNENAGPRAIKRLERRISAIEKLEAETDAMKAEYQKLREALTGATQRLEKCETLLGKK